MSKLSKIDYAVEGVDVGEGALGVRNQGMGKKVFLVQSEHPLCS
jgi:hypothetical protein